MKLHRTTGQPDWAEIKPADRNRFQTLAAKTSGVVTPANAVTVIGLAVVITGLVAIAEGHYWLGIIGLATGRLLDVVDGWLAEATGTKSPLGETMDATVDKLGTFATVAVFFAVKITAWWLLLAVILPHIIIGIIVLVALQRNERFHPSRLGKLSMAAAWVCLPGFVLIQALSLSSDSLLSIIVAGIALISSAMGLVSAFGYLTNRD